MAISSITYNNTDLLATDNITSWGGSGVTVAAAGQGPTADYTAYSVTSTAGGTAFINLDKTVTNVQHYLEFWIKQNTVSEARGYLRMSPTNYADSTSIIYGNGTAGDTGTGLGTIADLDGNWTLWGIDLGVIPAGTGSVRFGPADLFSTTTGDSVIIAAPRLAAAGSSGWTIVEGGFNPLSQGKIGIIGQPLRGKM